MALQKEHYKRRWTPQGPRSTLTWYCPIGERATHEAALRFAADPFDATLFCTDVEGDFRGGDINSGVWVMVASYAPASEVNRNKPDQAFVAEFETGADAIQIEGGYEFPSDHTPLIGENTRPVILISRSKIVLSGVRTSFDLSTFESLEDKVNDDSFLGAAAGTLLFQGGSGRVRTKADGSGLLYEVRIPLLHRGAGWNNFLRPDGEWEAPVKIDSDPAEYVYPAAEFDSLLAAPA